MDTTAHDLLVLDCPHWCTRPSNHGLLTGTTARRIHLGRTTDGREVEQHEVRHADGSLTRGPLQVIATEQPDPAA
ncbi:hypothetical protein ACQPX6_10225 [Actinomycetospora sp. CA-101289]|uniref:hypothetical protein n=1 Tax=Actinomycetospora sp. CA-101289 TaxID=3239893 RepID=UPI003D98F351